MKMSNYLHEKICKVEYMQHKKYQGNIFHRFYINVPEIRLDRYIFIKFRFKPVLKFTCLKFWKGLESWSTRKTLTQI